MALSPQRTDGPTTISFTPGSVLTEVDLALATTLSRRPDGVYLWSRAAERVGRCASPPRPTRRPPRRRRPRSRRRPGSCARCGSRARSGSALPVTYSRARGLPPARGGERRPHARHRHTHARRGGRGQRHPCRQTPPAREARDPPRHLHPGARRCQSPQRPRHSASALTHGRVSDGLRMRAAGAYERTTRSLIRTPPNPGSPTNQRPFERDVSQRYDELVRAETPRTPSDEARSIPADRR